MKNTYKFFNKTTGVILVAVILGLLAIYYKLHPLVPKLSINNHIFTYEIALTPQEVMKGLGDRDPLEENHGMLFVYDHKEQFQFWMKGMKFPLDMIWIDDNTVIDISKNVPVGIPGEQLPLYAPKQPVNRVFEVNAGTADKLGIKEGDRVEYLRK